MIFAHELHHLQRGDVDTKVFLVFCRALCWFNPLVWLAVRRASEDLELSCDEIVTEHMDRTGRGSYARLLLSSAAPSQGYTTCLSSTADGLRYRIHSILNRPRRRRGTALLMAALFLCTVSFGFVTMTDARGPFTRQALSGFEIRSVSFQGENSSGFSPVSTWDEDALLHCLDGLDAEHIAGPGNYAHPSAGPSLSLSGSRADSWQFITLYDGVAVVAGRNTEDYYLVTGDIPWASIQACLSL